MGTPDRRKFLRSMGGALGTAAVVSPAQAQSGSGRPVRLGLIGCGGRGTYLSGQIGKLKEDGEAVEITSVCDLYQPRLERLSTRLGAKAFGRSEELLSAGNVDGIIVATPDRAHVYESLKAVRAGKDVYCEKPLTYFDQFDQLKELVREVRQRKTVFQVGAQWVSDPMWAQAGEAVRKGALGKLTHAQTGYFRHGDSGERGMPIDDPKAKPGVGLDWDLFQADAPKRPFDVSRFFQWRLYLDYAGGPAMDLYPHPMTRLFKALGVGMPKRVVALGGQYFYRDGGRTAADTFDLLIEYPSGLNLAVLGTITNDSMIETVIRGTDATINFTGESRLVMTPQPGSDKDGGTFGLDTTASDHLADFLHCIRTREQPRGNLELGYTVQVPLIMAMQSWIHGKVANFDPAKEEIHLG